MAYKIELVDANNSTLDITSQVKGINIHDQLDNDVTSFDLTVRNLSNVYLFYRINIYKDNNIFVSGIVVNQADNENGFLKEKTTVLKCEDWGYIISRRIVAGTYTNIDAGQLLKTLIGKYANEISTSSIYMTNCILERVSFSYVTLKQAIEDILSMLPEWHYYIDKNKIFHLFNKFETDGTTFNESNILINSLKVEYNGQQSVNRVWIVGRKQASPNAIDVYFAGDGSQRYFLLPYEPNDTEIYLNEVKKVSSLESNDDGNRDFLINKKEKLVIIPSYREAYNGPIRVNFKPTKQLVDYYENNKVSKPFGVLEKAVKGQTVKSKLEARRYGLAEVKKSSEVKRKISFQSRVTNIAIGQRVTVTISNPLWNISGKFLVTTVNRSIVPGDEIVNFELEELI